MYAISQWNEFLFFAFLPVRSNLSFGSKLVIFLYIISPKRSIFVLDSDITEYFKLSRQQTVKDFCFMMFSMIFIFRRICNTQEKLFIH